jgi:hypothetical protein
VTLDASLKADLETLTNLLAHNTRGDLKAVLREAVRCAIEKHGKRKGMVKPRRGSSVGRTLEPHLRVGRRAAGSALAAGHDRWLGAGHAGHDR